MQLNLAFSACRVPPVNVLQLPAPPSISITTAPSTSPSPSPLRLRKPPRYWAHQQNLLAELRLFIRHHASSGTDNDNLMPTVSQLRAAGRFDLIKAIHLHGGFHRVAALLGLSCVRRSPAHVHSALFRVETLSVARSVIVNLSSSGHIPPGVMPTSAKLRTFGHSSLLNRITVLGGIVQVASMLGLSLSRERCGKVRNMTLSHRHAKHYWTSWRTVEAELRTFARTRCDGHMPLQRQLVSAGRTDLLNAIRHHGGLSHVARRAGLQPDPASMTAAKRPRGYWNDVSVVHAELLTFTARNGYPGLMPRREQLLRAGRSDLAYAVERHGGFGCVAASLHLVWHGPSSFWRVFKNFEKRMRAFIQHLYQCHVKNDNENESDADWLLHVMPNVQTLHKANRLDLVYGIALHGGVMAVAKRMGLSVVYRPRDEAFWHSDTNVKRELEAVLRIQPLETRQFMPSSTLLVQLGRADLATGIRDHGGWVYYAQKLGLRFAFDVRPQGFWQREANVTHELRNYVDQRYGDWERPGLIFGEEEEEEERKNKRFYIPSSDMLKRDGRSDLAFAIDTFHGAMNAFAQRHSFTVASDVVECKPADYFKKWDRFANALNSWIRLHGTSGIMPKKNELITTGRYDLRYATLQHGGFLKVARRMQLVYADGGVSMDKWLSQWLGLQAAMMGTLVTLHAEQQANIDDSGTRNTKIVSKVKMQLSATYRAALDGPVVGRSRMRIGNSIADALRVCGKEQRRLIRRNERWKKESERKRQIDANVKAMFKSSLARRRAVQEKEREERERREMEAGKKRGVGGEEGEEEMQEQMTRKRTSRTTRTRRALDIARRAY